ncbi:MAG: hypothetical protein LBQ27_01035, partial [Clostridiales bacterium]|nr:hypothetical protein [Clostridiales bacterium]
MGSIRKSNILRRDPKDSLMDKLQLKNQILREYEKNRHFAELKRKSGLESALLDDEFFALQREYNALVIDGAKSDDEGIHKARMAEIRKMQISILKKLKIDNFF